ncbi:transcription initiation factor IIA subunit 1 [Sphaerodactylus townsendi]|uniref:transcription initiation factor IIA subunit 1 n=1 Tax=Sphaerodactylus townsendi TaxID=933632 RepID=UPI002026B926|nr:transcription initiation factor IIA subunit 1 [Sphaerodactylus townsendi]
MANSTNTNPVPKLYRSVIEDVINDVREVFLDEGVDEQVLVELKTLWENKLLQSKAVDGFHSEEQQLLLQVQQQQQQQQQQHHPHHHHPQPQPQQTVQQQSQTQQVLIPATQQGTNTYFIHRSKNKWKFHLKDGIMNLNGRDYVFSKAIGDAEW